MTSVPGPDQSPAWRHAEFGFPGPLRDSLVAAILAGTKTSTTALLQDFQASGESLPAVGEQQIVIDSDARPVAAIELTEIRTVALRDVDPAHAVDEGEGDETVEQWRRNHETFWHSKQMPEAIGDPTFLVDDETPVVLQRFRLVGPHFPG